MAPGWPLSMALASFEAELWASTPFRAIGLVEPAANGRVDVHIRTRLVSTSTTIDATELEPGGAIDGLRASWELGPLIRTPIELGGAALIAAYPASAPDQRDHDQSLARIADRIAAVSAAGEPIEALDDRLTRSDALAAMLGTLGSALDLRDVFGQLSVVARQVLPH